MNEGPRVVTEFKMGLTEYRLVHDGIEYQLHCSLNMGGDIKRWVKCEDISHILSRRLEELSQ